ncbi:hypothetical protein GCM10009738_07950 [Kitasatospora viridis]
MRRARGPVRLRTHTARILSAAAALGLAVGLTGPLGRTARSLAAQLVLPDSGASVASLALIALALLVTGSAAVAWSHRSSQRADRSEPDC